MSIRLLITALTLLLSGCTAGFVVVHELGSQARLASEHLLLYQAIKAEPLPVGKRQPAK